jgi:hypothetical protein
MVGIVVYFLYFHFIKKSYASRVGRPMTVQHTGQLMF